MRAASAVVLSGFVLAACVGDEKTGTATGSSSGGSSSGASTSGGAGVLETFDEESGCSGWESDSATLTTAPGHDSAGSCQACSNGTYDYVFVNRFIERPSNVGDHYELSAYVRDSADKPVLQSVAVQLLGVDDKEETIDEASNQPAVSPAWLLSVTQLAITKPGARQLKISISGNVPPGKGSACIVFDDVVLKRK